MSDGRAIISLIGQRQDLDQFRKKNWVGTFDEYLDIVRERPEVTRTAYERLYDMILSYGVDTYEANRERHERYRFFSDPDDHGKDAVFGLDNTLRSLYNTHRTGDPPSLTERGHSWSIPLPYAAVLFAASSFSHRWGSHYVRPEPGLGS